MGGSNGSGEMGIGPTGVIGLQAKKASDDLDDAVKTLPQSVPRMLLRPEATLVTESSLEKVRVEQHEAALSRLEVLLRRASNAVGQLEEEKDRLERERRRRSEAVQEEVDSVVEPQREAHATALRRLEARKARLENELKECDEKRDSLRSQVQKSRSALLSLEKDGSGSKGRASASSLSELKRLRAQTEAAESASSVLRAELRELRTRLEEEEARVGGGGEGSGSGSGKGVSVGVRVQRLRARVAVLRASTQHSPGKARPGTVGAAGDEAREVHAPAIEEARHARAEAESKSAELRDATAHQAAQLASLIETTLPGESPVAAAAAALFRATMHGSGSTPLAAAQAETQAVHGEEATQQALQFLTETASVLRVEGDNLLFNE